MKLYILFFISVLSVCSSFAQRVVALHSASGVSVYSSVNPLLDAYNEAVDGDTLYLPGGAFLAPTMFDKKLYIYGAGYHPDSTIATNPTLITGNINLGENSDYSIFEGIQFSNSVNTDYNVSASYITFKRCRLNTGFNFQGDGVTNLSINNAFVECVLLGNLHYYNLTNSSIFNSFIQNVVIDSKSNVFKNNIFSYNNTSNWNGGVLHRPYYNEFSNNIFLNTNYYLIYQANDGNIYNNNIFVATSFDYGANAITTGNYVGVIHADIFINQSGYAFDYNHDYQLQNPETYVGNDAYQVGIYGGVFPYKAGAVPVNPHISAKVISGTTNSNGELPIEIKINAQDK
jgi:hypothetical protein